MDFVKASGINAIREWMAGLDEGAQAAIDTRLLQMRAMQRWPPTFAKKYKAIRGKIFEIRIAHNRIKYRPLGCYGPGRFQFTLLTGTIERGGKLPKGDLGRAETRYKLIMKDASHVCEHDFQ